MVDRVQELMERLDGLADPAARATAEELVGTLMDLYGEGLARTMELVDDDTRARLADDGVVGSLLLLHGLYPVPLADRVREALDTVQPYMQSHGGAVELLEITDGDVVRLRLQGSCKSCAASRSTLELAIKAALDEHAPDLAGIEVVGMEDPAAQPLHITKVQPGWTALNGASAVPDGELAGETVAGVALVVANVDGTLLAYRDTCPSCGAALHEGELYGPNLECPGCERHFDITRAGIALDGTGQLAPVPLLREGATARVAV